MVFLEKIAKQNAIVNRKTKTNTTPEHDGIFKKNYKTYKCNRIT